MGWNICLDLESNGLDFLVGAKIKRFSYLLELSLAGIRFRCAVAKTILPSNNIIIIDRGDGSSQVASREC
jgi:hypothetical protein